MAMSGSTPRCDGGGVCVRGFRRNFRIFVYCGDGFPSALSLHDTSALDLIH